MVKEMNKLLLGVAGLAAMMMASSAGAALKLDIGGTVYADGGAFDANGANETITLIDGLLGFPGIPGFTGSITTGRGDAASPYPQLLSLSFDMTSSGGGPLTVMLTDTDVNYSIENLILSTGVNTDVQVDYQLYIGAAGAEFDLSGGVVATNSVGTVPDKSFDVAYLGAPTSNPFSLTLVAVISASDAGDYVGNNTVVRVPEPSIIALFGAGLLGVGLARRRMKK
jgi:hypothetical protein